MTSPDQPRADNLELPIEKPKPGVDDPDAQAARLRVDLVRTEDQLVRALADLDNYRKRFDRELVRLQQLEREKILRDLLPVADNLERALSSSPDVNGQWRAGIEAVQKQLISLLQRYGVDPIEDKGRPFDPEWHDVIATVQSDSDDGTIVDVAERGYRLGERPLRHARVVVAAHK